MTELRARILELYSHLSAHFGHEPHWWPIFSETPPFEVIVGAVLVQQTRWEAVEGAIRRLMVAGLLSPAALAAANTDELAAMIRPCAFHTQKAPGLQAICRYLLERYGGNLDALFAQEQGALRAELLVLPRIGPETADTIMLYAGGHPVFIADAYARRLFSRIGLAPGFDFNRASYEALRQLIEGALTRCDCELQIAGCRLEAPICNLQSAIRGFPHLDGSLRHFLWDLHALITEECIHHCLATKPRQDQPGARRNFLDPRKCAAHCLECQGCPLRPICATYKNQDPGTENLL